MVDVAAVSPQPKWKVRKVSAVRDFPPGCGRHTATVNLTQTETSLSLVKSQQVTEPDASSVQLLPSLETSLETPKYEPVESVETTKVVASGKVLDEAAMLKLEKEDDEEQMRTQKEKHGKLENEMGSFLLVPNSEDKDQQNLVELAYANGGADVSATLTELSAERSKVDESVDAAITEPIVPVESVKGEVPIGVTAEELMLSTEAPRRDNISDMSVELPRSSGEAPQTNVGQKRSYSKTYPPPKRRKVSAVRDFPPGCGTLVNVLDGVEDAITVCHSAENLSRCLDKQDGMMASVEGLHNLSEEKFMEHNANSKLPVVDVVTAESCLNADIVDTGGENVLDGSNSHNGKAEAPSPLVGNSSSGGVSEQSEKETSVKHCCEKVSAESFRKVKVGMTTSDADPSSEKIQDMSGDAHARSVPRNSSRKFSEDNDESEVLERSATEKKTKMDEVKPDSTTTPFKETHQIELACVEPKRTKPCGKLVDNEPKTPGVVLKKASVRSLKDITNPRANTLSKSRDKGYGMVVQTESSNSLEDLGTKVIVQSLMASQSCPWRQGKKSSDFKDCVSTTPRKRVKKDDSLSVTLQNKVKREGTFSRKKVFGEPSTSEGKKKGAIDEDEEVAYEDDCSTDKVLKAYKNLREMNVNLIPFDPSLVDNKTGDGEERVTRNKVKRALRLFQVLWRKLLQGEEAKKVSGSIKRIDLAVAGILKKSKQWVNVGKAILGEVPGVEVGDEFHFRVELSIVGLHRPFQGGIDWTKINDTLLATSIVASGGYPDEMENSDVLIYSGQGGKPIKGKKAGDQKLERGNLALKNSIDAQTPVRVIRGYKEQIISDSSDSRAKKYLSTFTYDGLYQVENFWPEMDKHGFQVFKFRLKRIPGQPELAFKELSKSKKSKVREGQIIADISGGKERRPICVVNTIDDERPAPFKYITKIMYPTFYVYTPPLVCSCTRGCSDSENCACAVKNGGEIPFNFNGAIVQAKPLVYECGPSCMCPPTCHNRVSQNGIKIQLEVFKTKSRGWGVRSLRSIPAGTFICEYIGELLKDTDAEQRSNDEYLFDIGHNYDDHALWEGLPNTIPGLQSSSHGAGDDDGFTIDAAESGNVGRFINHSCSPNLYAQNVLFDHDDKRMPHIMFFAADNIPPLQELTYHYNYTIDKVHDSNGNIKQKSCYCGSPECTGRLY